MIGISADIFTRHEDFFQPVTRAKAHIDKVCARMTTGVKKNLQLRLFLVTAGSLLFALSHSLCLTILIFSPP
ncbi:hypothetical protein ETA_01100 [Erwinia tasmaniensis Et1/99]|uniref:Uncharacterized protein n=1 Tax=Erwinia tasmaniensis (strain DSM 17950 / CFBP 7177 / CIP 109463 / NCPPB 4357 / Et1/99) TaxID=465817 RepID=B2VER5_ERWT9|nr:hypothetical protein ETA_01100 [Erwinia tasmaniensis Et1/99]